MHAVPHAAAGLSAGHHACTMAIQFGCTYNFRHTDLHCPHTSHRFRDRGHCQMGGCGCVDSCGIGPLAAARGWSKFHGFKGKPTTQCERSTVCTG